MFVMIIEYKSFCSFLDDQNISKQFEHKLSTCFYHNDFSCGLVTDVSD